MKSIITLSEYPSIHNNFFEYVSKVDEKADYYNVVKFIINFVHAPVYASVRDSVNIYVNDLIQEKT